MKFKKSSGFVSNWISLEVDMGWLDFITGKNKPSRFVLEYENLFKNKIPKDCPIPKLTFTVIDTETTGFDIKSNYIIAYGSVRVQGYSIKISSVKEYFLKPKKQDREAIKVHGIIKTEGFIPLEDFIRIFLKDIGNSILVAHHAAYDKAMLEKAANSVGITRLKNPVLDTASLAIRLELGPNYPPGMVNNNDYSLDSLCMRYHIPLDDRHTASGDAYLTAQLFVKLLKIAETKGIYTFGELMRR